jgi:hypothetical protein
VRLWEQGKIGQKGSSERNPAEKLGEGRRTRGAWVEGMNRVWLLLWSQQEKKCRDDCDRDLGIRQQGTGEPSSEAYLALLLDAPCCGTPVDVGGRSGTEEQEAE